MLEAIWGPKRFLTFLFNLWNWSWDSICAADFFEKIPLKRDVETYLIYPNPEDFEHLIIKHKQTGLNMSQLGELSDEYYDNSDNPYYRNQTMGVVREMYARFVTRSIWLELLVQFMGYCFALAFLFPNTEFYIYMLFPVKQNILPLVWRCWPYIQNLIEVLKIM